MKFIFYFLVSYLLYGAFLIGRDFTTNWRNAPEYVRDPNPVMIIYALIRKPLLINGVAMCLVIVGVIGLILFFIFG